MKPIRVEYVEYIEPGAKPRLGYIVAFSSDVSKAVVVWDNGGLRAEYLGVLLAPGFVMAEDRANRNA